MENKDYLVEEFSNNKIKIIFFGSKHGNYPEQINKIREIITNFSPEIVLVEGGFENADFPSEEEAIRNGESAFTCFLAKSREIVLKGNDPSNIDQINFLIKKYDKNSIFAYFILRNFASRYDKDRIKKHIDNFKAVTKWKDFDYSFEAISNHSKKILGKEISEISIDYFNPNLNLSKFNDITKELSEFRDNYLIKTLKSLVLSYKKIFVIKGKSHLLKQKQEIAKLIK